MTVAHSGDGSTGRIDPPEPVPADLSAYVLPDGRPMALFQVLAHSPVALADLRGATARALGGDLELRFRELLVLRITQRLGAVSEQQAHRLLFAAEARIGDDELDAIARPDGAGLIGADRLAIRLADALVGGGEIRDALWSELMAALGTPGVVEAVFVGAQYVKVAIMANALRVPVAPEVEQA